MQVDMSFKCKKCNAIGSYSKYLNVISKNEGTICNGCGAFCKIPVQWIEDKARDEAVRCLLMLNAFRQDEDASEPRDGLDAVVSLIQDFTNRVVEKVALRQGQPAGDWRARLRVSLAPDESGLDGRAEPDVPSVSGDPVVKACFDDVFGEGGDRSNVWVIDEKLDGLGDSVRDARGVLDRIVSRIEGAVQWPEAMNVLGSLNRINIGVKGVKETLGEVMDVVTGLEEAWAAAGAEAAPERRRRARAEPAAPAPVAAPASASQVGEELCAWLAAHPEQARPLFEQFATALWDDERRALEKMRDDLPMLLHNGFDRHWDFWRSGHLSDAERAARGQVEQVLGQMRSTIEDWVDRHEFERIPDDRAGPASYNNTLHQARGTVGTDDDEKLGKIAEVLEYGYRWRGKRLSWAKVTVYVPAKNASGAGRSVGSPEHRGREESVRSHE